MSATMYVNLSVNKNTTLIFLFFENFIQQCQSQPKLAQTSTINSQIQSMHGFPAPRMSSTHCNQVPEKKQSATATRISSKHVEQSETKNLLVGVN